MFLKGLDFVKKLLSESANDADGSVSISDPKVLQRYTDDPSFPFLVSFPRTGSHWLRMIMELYFGRPLLTRTFFNKDRTDYLLLHTHDIDLDIMRGNVVYLYRDPVDTVFSQLMYYKEDITDEERVRHWAGLYGRHLAKWLHDNGFTEKLTVVKYERLRDDPAAEFKKITDHFGVEFDGTRLDEALKGATKEKLKEKTGHDPQVVNLKADYSAKRKQFRTESEGLVWEELLSGREYLKKDF